MTVKLLSQRTPAPIHLQGDSYDAAAASTWRAWLSEAERSRLASFGAVSRRHEFLLGRALARRLLGSCLDVAPGRVPLHRAEDDGVDVGREGWFVSIAHSGESALVGAARHPLGIDLELIQPRDPAVADFLFAPEDRDLPDALPYDPDASLILCWAMKEAVLKARRSGFRRSPKDLRLSVDPDAGTARVRVEEGRTWTVGFARLDGFWGTVAVPAPQGTGD